MTDQRRPRPTHHDLPTPTRDIDMSEPDATPRAEQPVLITTGATPLKEEQIKTDDFFPDCHLVSSDRMLANAAVRPTSSSLGVESNRLLVCRVFCTVCGHLTTGIIHVD